MKSDLNINNNSIEGTMIDDHDYVEIKRVMELYSKSVGGISDRDDKLVANLSSFQL